MEKRFLGIEDLAEYLDLSVNTLRSWVWQRKIPFLKLGRLIRFDLMQINKWLEEKQVKNILT